MIRHLARTGIAGKPMPIVLVEQYYDFAEELADSFIVLQRGEGDRAR